MNFRQIYESRADEYDALVSAEDVDGNLLPALNEIIPLQGRRFVEVGAGTGRVTKVLTDGGASVVATEPASAMINFAARSLHVNDSAWLCRAEAGSLPVGSQSVDAAIAGWVLGHQIEWAPDTWRQTVGAAIADMERTVHNNPEPGPVIIIETLGTNHTTPIHPGGLGEYYHWLEEDLGFSSTWIRTDYLFSDAETAAQVMGNFFGQAMADQVRSAGLARVPECTGLWWRSAT